MKCIYCDNSVVARGLCSAHYFRFYRSKSFVKLKKSSRQKKTIQYTCCRFCGKQTRSKISCCKKCYFSYGLKAQHDRDARKKKMKIIINTLGGCCAHCGSKDNLEIDHKYPAQKKFTICQHITKPLDELLEEAKKCQLLCRYCHMQKTAIENKRHGSHGMSKICHCAKCIQTRRIDNLRRIRKKGKMVGLRTKEEAIKLYIKKYGSLI